MRPRARCTGSPEGGGAPTRCGDDPCADRPRPAPRGPRRAGPVAPGLRGVAAPHRPAPSQQRVHQARHQLPEPARPCPARQPGYRQAVLAPPPAWSGPSPGRPTLAICTVHWRRLAICTVRWRRLAICTVRWRRRARPSQHDDRGHTGQQGPECKLWNAPSLVETQFSPDALVWVALSPQYRQTESVLSGFFLVRSTCHERCRCR